VQVGALPRVPVARDGRVLHPLPRLAPHAHGEALGGHRHRLGAVELRCLSHRARAPVAVVVVVVVHAEHQLNSNHTSALWKLGRLLSQVEVGVAVVAVVVVVVGGWFMPVKLACEKSATFFAVGWRSPRVFCSQLRGVGVAGRSDGRNQ
jgi:hypothetical protein